MFQAIAYTNLADDEKEVSMRGGFDTEDAAHEWLQALAHKNKFVVPYESAQAAFEAVLGATRKE